MIRMGHLAGRSRCNVALRSPTVALAQTTASLNTALAVSGIAQRAGEDVVVVPDVGEAGAIRGVVVHVAVARAAVAEQNLAVVGCLELIQEV